MILGTGGALYQTVRRLLPGSVRQNGFAQR